MDPRLRAVEEDTVIPVRYELTAAALAGLREVNVPASVVEKLASLRGRTFDTRSQLLAALARVLGPNELARFQDAVANRAALRTRRGAISAARELALPQTVPFADEAVEPAFNQNFSAPWNQIFKVVFFPDRIYHAQYLNATRSPRYRYNVLEVRGRADFLALKTEVFLDGKFLCNALRLEYRAGRLAEQVRERGRLLRGEVLAWVELRHKGMAEGDPRLKRYLKMFFDPYVDAYQVEIWETLEPPATGSHSFKVLDQMGLHKPITMVPSFRGPLRHIRELAEVRLAFRETVRDRPFDYAINNPGWDNDYTRSHQEPNRPPPNSPENTVDDRNYFVNFQRGWVLDADQVPPVLYQNAMMEPSSDDYYRGPAPDPGDQRKMEGDKNVMGMRWIIQRELGGTIIYFHKVELPPGAVEGTHQHVGSEEVYYFIEGEGVAYVGDGDDPEADRNYPLVGVDVTDPATGQTTRVRKDPDIYGLGPKPCREVPVRPGITIFTKSGGIHGVRNPKGNKSTLKFVAFGYHSS